MSDYDAEAVLMRIRARDALIAELDAERARHEKAKQIDTIEYSIRTLPWHTYNEAFMEILAPMFWQSWHALLLRECDEHAPHLLERLVYECDLVARHQNAMVTNPPPCAVK